jgi:hypothetical protein
MSQSTSGIIKIVLLAAFVGLIGIDRVAGNAFPRARKAAFAVIALAMLPAWVGHGEQADNLSPAYLASGIILIVVSAWLVLSARPAGLWSRPWLAPGIAGCLFALWVSFGVARGSLPLVHHAEQFHFYFGAKYQREVGWFDLYPAAIAADRETVNVLASARHVRDIHTFEVVSIEDAEPAIERAKQKFSPEQWARFKSDWTETTRLYPHGWHVVITDHGNSSSPAWSLFAHPLSRVVPRSAMGQSILGWIDMALLFGMWLFVLATFGGRRASAALVLFAAAPIVFLYTSGSLLRWDWLFATGMTICFLRRERWATAGAFFGYAVMTKLFPVFFGVAFLIHHAWQAKRTRQIPRSALRFLLAAFVCALVVVASSSAAFGTGAWREYAERISLAQNEKFYSIQFSLRTVFLQFAVPLSSGKVNLVDLSLFPRVLHQAQPGVSIDDYAVSFFIVRLFFTAMVALLIRRTTAWEAFALGPLLVMIWLVVNMYYWCMLGFVALSLFGRRDRPGLGLLLALYGVLMFYYVHQRLSRPLTEGYVVAWLVLLSVVVTALWEGRTPLARRS